MQITRIHKLNTQCYIESPPMHLRKLGGFVLLNLCCALSSVLAIVKQTAENYYYHCDSRLLLLCSCFSKSVITRERLHDIMCRRSEHKRMHRAITTRFLARCRRNKHDVMSIASL